PQRDDVVNSDGDAFGHVGHGLQMAKHHFRSVSGPGSQRPMVEALETGSKRRGPAIKVEWSYHRRDRARRRGGARAFASLGKELGIALVQAHDGVSNAIDSERLTAP